MTKVPEAFTVEELALIEGMLSATAGNIKNNIKRYGWKALAAKVGRMREQARAKPAEHSKVVWVDCAAERHRHLCSYDPGHTSNACLLRGFCECACGARRPWGSPNRDVYWYRIVAPCGHVPFNERRGECEVKAAAEYAAK